MFPYRFTRSALVAFVAAVLSGVATLGLPPRSAQAAPDVCIVNAHNPHSLTIQQAVDSGCSRILITPGTYRESVVIPEGRTVSLVGVAGAQKTVVDGSRGEEFSDRELIFFINQNASVTLRGLTIQNGGGGDGGGIAEILFPGGEDSRALGINDKGQIVGDYWDGATVHSFLLGRGTSGVVAVV